jgi:hypothetical protein
MLHNGRVYVRPLKHFASRRLRQTIRSAQTGHQLLLGTARERSPASTRSKAALNLPLVIGVMGVGGPKDESVDSQTQYQGTTHEP